MGGQVSTPITIVSPPAPAFISKPATKVRKNASARLNPNLLERYSQALEGDIKSNLASTLLSKVDFIAALNEREASTVDVPIFNTKLSTELDITNQKQSGRCWLFATTNVIRINLARKLNLDKFQYSQSYLFFYDSLHKANFFLEQMIDLSDSAIDDRTVQYLLSAPENDGGQWDMAVALVEAVGLIPQSLYPESFNSSASSKLDGLITTKLREFALELRQIYDDSMASLSTSTKSEEEKKSISQQSTRSRKEDQLQEIHRILVITLGAPPSPSKKFTWEFYDKDKKYHSLSMTPLEFYKFAGYDVTQSISLINDPRNAYDKTYTVSRLGNVYGGRPVRYVNTEIEILKATAIALLSADQPVWFGCDVGKYSSSLTGIMDPKLYNFEKAFDIKLGLNKSERLKVGDSAMTHAMTIVGVHLEDGRPVRWRIENSWGIDAGENGYMVMSDQWFTENVFQVVAPKSRIDKRLVSVYEDPSPAHVFPPWDPMGSLA